MPENLVTRLARLSVAGLADIFDRRCSVPPVLSREMKPVGNPCRFAGPAYCVKGSKLNNAGWLPVSSERDALYDALDLQVPVGAVLLFDCGGYDDTAVFGGGAGVPLKMRGCAGVIVDGAVRDIEELVREGPPTLARAVSAIRFVGRFRLTATNCPIEIRGLAGPIAVSPQDLVLADHDGVIILPRALAEDLIAEAEHAKNIDAQIKAEVLRGMSRLDAGRKHRPR